MRIEALLFDLGGVVIDIDFGRSVARWAALAGCDAAALRKRVVVDETYHAYERGEIACADFFNYLAGALDLKLNEEQLRDGWNAIFVGEMPGMASIIAEAAKRWPLYVLSNTNRAHELFWAREYAGTLGHFRKLFVSSTIGLRKPEAACYDHVVREIGVPADRIMFFDDVAENIVCARAAGLVGVHTPATADIRRALDGLGL